MIQLENLTGELAAELKKPDADYLDARLEASRTSHITYRGRRLDSAGRASAAGGNVRALCRGGWGFVSFNEPGELPGRVTAAVQQAKLAGRGKSRLAPLEPATAVIAWKGGRNPVSIPLEEKKRLLDEYLEIVWRTPRIQTAVMHYADSHQRTVFLSSAGSVVKQERADITLNLSVIAADNGDVQQAGFSLGSPGDFGAVQGLQAQVAATARRAVELLAAPPVKAGEYTVVLDPVLAGVFVHEAFGHLSEADSIYENAQLRNIMQLGRQFGSPSLNIVDTAALPGLRGSYHYDDEGVPAARTYLIREGRLTGRLHSRETAGQMNEPLTGNARAVSYRFPPIVRMTNTFIEPGDITFEEMIADIEEGIYARNWHGGTTSLEMFTFSAGEAYMIRHGKIAELLRPVVLTGNVFTTLKNIDAIGNDLEMNQGGGCGKGGQSPLPVSNGSPHIRIRHCLVGGA